MKIFNNVADLKLARLATGQIVKTKGYYTPNDGGGGEYIIVTAGTGTDDGGSYIDLALNQAELIYKGEAGVAVFGAVGDGVADDTTALNNAIDFAFQNSLKLIVEKGVYLNTGLELVVSDLNDRDKSIVIEGANYGESFATLQTGGAVFRSETENPVFKINDPVGATVSAGSALITGIFFDGDSDTFPIVHLEAFYGHSLIERCVVRQRGIGDGVQIDYAATGEIRNSYVYNKDFASFTLGNARVGKGVWYKADTDAGLFTLNKVTSRGWLDPFVIGDSGSGHVIYNTRITDCESSVSFNGLHITPEARNTYVDNHYFEGADQGTGILDEANYTTINACNVFSGYTIGLDSTADTRGNVYTASNFSTSTLPNVELVKITDNVKGKTFRDNTLTFGGSGGSIVGVVGLTLAGTAPSVDLSKNNFDPISPWTGGVGTQKISDVSTSGGLKGFSQGFNGSQFFPLMSRGALSLEWGDNIITEADVSGNVLTIPDGSVFRVNSTTPTTVNNLDVSNKQGRFIIFVLESANLTFADTALQQMAGPASFSGVGVIAFITREIGGITYSYELFRSSY